MIPGKEGKATRMEKFTSIKSAVSPHSGYASSRIQVNVQPTFGGYSSFYRQWAWLDWRFLKERHWLERVHALMVFGESWVMC